MKDFILAPSCPPHLAEVGELVITETDNGEDLGVIVQVMSMSEMIERRIAARPTALEEEENDVGRILRVASPFERAQLPAKFHDEDAVIQVQYSRVLCSSMV